MTRLGEQSSGVRPCGRWIAGLLVGVVIAYFLLMEHRQHLFAALPFLILLACPLMHIFMHHGRSSRHQGEDQ